MAKNREMVDANAMIVQISKDGRTLLRMELADFVEFAAFYGFSPAERPSIERPYRLSVTTSDGDDVHIVPGVAASIERTVEPETVDLDDEIFEGDVLDLDAIDLIDPEARDDQADGSKK